MREGPIDRPTRMCGLQASNPFHINELPRQTMVADQKQVLAQFLSKVEAFSGVPFGAEGLMLS